MLPYLLSAGLDVVQKVVLPERRARYAAVPGGLDQNVRRFLIERFPAGLYQHQAAAIEAGLSGEDLCLATATASGKSLVFMALAAHRLRQDPRAKVLALYPARALILDQHARWARFARAGAYRFGYIDGGIPMERRPRILERNNVVLMTPDVVHAWLMRNIGMSEVSRFLACLSMVVLDDAHVYDGVFGTNVAYLMRRLAAIAARFQVISSSATFGESTAFFQELTGREAHIFDAASDRSFVPEKTIYLARPVRGQRAFDASAALLRMLAASEYSPFLAFADSRRRVEVFSAAMRDWDGARPGPAGPAGAAPDEDTDPGLPDALWRDAGARVLPYRAGYETRDRNAVQAALTEGRVDGIVSTSALELGIDVGHIRSVVLLNTPPSVKSFWQRIGRAGRREPGFCVLMDERRALAGDDPLGRYLARPLEPNRLYLDNRYVQYANVLCAALELGAAGKRGDAAKRLDAVPKPFNEMLDNELKRGRPPGLDLIPLKQRGTERPHLEFPIRGPMERHCQLVTRDDRALGSIGWPHVLREAYPGAVYYHMGRPFRVLGFSKSGYRLVVVPGRGARTRPLLQTMLFANLRGRTARISAGADGFRAEVELHGSERVTGFIERRGAQSTTHEYGPESQYCRRELNRFFATTGVCWHARDPSLTSPAAAAAIAEAFAIEHGIHRHDIGVGPFYSRFNPIGPSHCDGICIFDANHGSLQLTRTLARHWSDILHAATELARSRDDEELASTLASLLAWSEAFMTVRRATPIPVYSDKGTDWTTVVLLGQKVLHYDSAGPAEVEVIEYADAPHGLLYRLRHDDPQTRWFVPADNVEPIPGLTRFVRANPATDEIEIV